MEEMYPAVSVTVSLGNPVCDSSGVTARMEIARIKVVTGTSSLFSDPAKVVYTESLSSGCSSCTDVKKEVKMGAGVESGSGGGGADLMEMWIKDRKGSIVDDVMIRKSEDYATNGIINEEFSVLQGGSKIGLQNSTKIEIVENGKILPASVILDDSSFEHVSTIEVLIPAVSPDVEISNGPNLRVSAVYCQLPNEKNLIRGSKRSVFDLDCIPLWGSVSIPGGTTEMEDAVVAVPWFMKIPIKMLIGDHATGVTSQSLTHLTSHFFGVYDGHGGSQVANYCCERIHLALLEEIGIVNGDLSHASLDNNRQLQWEKVFTSCFQKVDDEIAGKVSRGTIGSNEDAFNTSFQPIAPETVGSTAVVALVISSHIIVANCGDSRAVLYRGKEPMALSVDHKPDREDEYARIEASGGKVIPWKGLRVCGVLAMSRSIGDRYLKPLIIPEPEVMFVPRARDDECLIIASDGLWDVMKNDEACEVARKRILLWHKKNSHTSLVDRGKGIDPAAQSAADYLSMLAVQKGSKDNISVIVVDLKAQRTFKSKP